MRRSCLIAVWLATALGSTMARAECPPSAAIEGAREAAVEAAIDRATAALKAGPSAEAAGAIEHALGAIDWADPFWRRFGLDLARRLADVRERLEQPAEARAAYVCIRAHADAEDAMARHAAERIAVIDDRQTPRVAVDSTPTGAELSIDDQPRGPTPWRGRLTTGGHAFRLTAPQHVAHAGVLDIQAGEPLELTVPLVPQARLRIAGGDGAWAVSLGEAETDCRLPAPCELWVDPGPAYLLFVLDDAHERITLDAAPGAELSVTPPPVPVQWRPWAIGGGATAAVAGGVLLAIAGARYAEFEAEIGGEKGRDEINALRSASITYGTAGGVLVAAGLTAVGVALWPTLWPADGAGDTAVD